MSTIALLPTFLAIAILIGIYLLLRQTGWRSRRGSSRSGGSSFFRGSSRSLGPASSASRRRLMRLVNGNEKTAIRLVANLKATHPDRSEQWCWEKAIYDLERDRRA